MDMNERQKKLRAALDAQMEQNEQLQARAEADDATAEDRSAWVAGIDRAEVIASNIENESRAAKLREAYADEPEDRQEAGPYREVAGGSAGEQFIRAVGERLQGVDRRSDRFSFAAEIRATPTVSTGLVDADKGGVVTLPLERPTIEDVLLSGQISGNAYQYMREGAVTGGPTTVAEAGQKPELSGQFTQVTDPLGKVAGWTKESDEIIEDFPLLKSVIEGRLISRVNLIAESQILNGTGTAPQLRGILNVSGVQTQTQSTETAAEAIFKGITKVATASFLNADFIVINPADYEALRLAKDSNGQYFGGGFFAGPYGNGGVPAQPGLWGLRTIVTSAITAKTVLVGASQAAQVFSKGGIRVDIANQNEDDFIHDLVTVRAERRLLVATYLPTALCKVTLT